MLVGLEAVNGLRLRARSGGQTAEMGCLGCLAGFIPDKYEGVDNDLLLHRPHAGATVGRAKSPRSSPSVWLVHLAMFTIQALNGFGW